MSGHSKWSKVKHQKATTDAVKANAFTKASRGLTIAVREGGGIADPDKNFRLRLAIEKARGVNMPKENIERAIARGIGTGAGAIEQLHYEGYGPGGVAVLVEAATDNRARTVSAIKNIFDRAGGTLASPGAVSYLFVRSGIITVPRTGHTTDELLALALDAGADDVREKEDMYEIYAAPARLAAVRQTLEEKGIVIDNAALIMKPTSCVPVTDGIADRVERLTEALEESDDVQHVYTNIA